MSVNTSFCHGHKVMADQSKSLQTDCFFSVSSVELEREGSFSSFYFFVMCLMNYFPEKQVAEHRLSAPTYPPPTVESISHF